MKILSDAEDIKDIPSLEIVQNLISKVVAKTVPCDNEVITENYKLGTNVQTALSNLLTYTYVNASGIGQLSTSLQSAWNAINAVPTYTGGSGIVVSGSVIGHSNNLTADGTVNTGEIQSPDFGENATLTWFRYDKQGHVTFTGSGGIKIPTADTTLSSTSTRPISSKAVYDNLKASVIRATTKTVGSGSGAVSIYDDVQETLEGFQSHIYKLHTDFTSLGSNVGALNTYKDSINISAGSKTVPVYFNNGVPTVCQYTLGSMCKESADDYLPITGGTLTGKLTVNSDIVIPTAKAVADNTVPVSGSLATITDNDFTQLKNYKSIIGSIKNSTDNVWYDVISVRHRNGYNDGSNYGMYLYSNLTSSGDLIWNKQTAASTWQGERTIIDSGNYTTYFKNSASNIAGTGLEYVEGTDSSGKSFMKINHKKGAKSGSIGPDPVTYTPNFGETFDVGYAQYDDTGHIILSSTATIKLPKYSALKNPYALTIQGNGTKLVTYDGAGPVTLNITPSSIGAAASSHTHSYLPLEYKSDIIINRTTLGTQRKNLLKNTAVTKTVNGVTFTVNDDKSITVSGKSTSSSTTFFNVCKALELTLENDKSYIMTGCPENNKSSDNKTLCYLRADSSKGVIANDTGNGVTFTTSESSSPTYAIICVSANADFTDNPVTFYPMIRYADILDDTYEPYQPSLVERCLLKDTAGIALGAAQSSSITIDNLSSYTALWVNVSGGVSGINFTTNLIVPIAYLAKSTSNSVQLAGGIPSSAYITSEGALAAKDMNGTITAKVSGNTLNLTIGTGTIGAIEVVSLM